MRIAKAVWRLAAHRGLEAVSLRQVADEAEVSMRLVQYYFHTKQRLLQESLGYLDAWISERARLRHSGTGEATGRALLRLVLAEFLPVDEDRRLNLLVRLAYFTRALSDPEVAEVFLGNPPELQDYFVDQLRALQERGDLDAGLDPEMEMETLFSVATALGIDMLLDLRDEAATMAILDYNLDRLFGPR
ncbi:TetR/AcrR family transcriptional regulator [Amycolatopsis sp. CA-230715]|uniref:TetR/AcrR family transcriptional regulator n=1 Tax=Amycolatopsis sp. CA-230715 TaxID=2745196 RepID=UPI001C0191B1|nr:TetR/AcrR family transcriptional regulator [Amycolatopsis sp. CA-230715]QWF83838.1 hypothetical protein HUW46_07281 [Amycolatopsis sp. CA-230715]